MDEPRDTDPMIPRYPGADRRTRPEEWGGGNDHFAAQLGASTSGRLRFTNGASSCPQRVSERSTRRERSRDGRPQGTGGAVRRGVGLSRAARRRRLPRRDAHRRLRRRGTPRFRAEQAAVAGTVRWRPFLRVLCTERGGGAPPRGGGGGHGPPEAGRRVPGQRRGGRVPGDPCAGGEGRPLAAGRLARQPHRRGALVPGPLTFIEHPDTEGGSTYVEKSGDQVARSRGDERPANGRHLHRGRGRRGGPGKLALPAPWYRTRRGQPLLHRELPLGAAERNGPVDLDGRA